MTKPATSVGVARVMFLAVLILFAWGPSASAATHVVFVPMDFGPGSLRDAVAMAGSGDTIQINLPLEIALTSEIVIDKDLTITGMGSSTVISGSNATRMFRITAGKVEFRDLVLRSGRVAGGNGASAQAGGGGGGGGATGGAIFIDTGAHVTLERVQVNDSKAIGGNGGNSTGGSNLTGGSGGTGAAGAGSGGTTGQSSGFAAGGSAGAGAGSGGGGGAAGYGAGGSGGKGGELGGGGGGSGNTGTGLATIAAGVGGLFGGSGGTNRTEMDGQGGGGGGGAGLGGAIFVNRGAMLALKLSDFNDNQAQGGSAGLGGLTSAQSGRGKGGAVFAMDGARVEVYDAHFHGNIAADAGTTGWPYDGSLHDNPDIYGHIWDSPGVLRVTSASPDGVYEEGDTILIDVVFSQPVSVFGTPVLTLETGTNDATAVYVSGSDTDTLRFAYTVEHGHTSDDLDYAGTNALSLNNGMITYFYDGFIYNAHLALPEPGGPGSLSASADLLVDAGAWFVVTNTEDHGPGSLRDLLATIQPGERIRFAPSLAGQTLTLSSPLEIAKSTKISGFATPGLVISGNDSVGIFRINDGNVTLEGLTLANGRAANGGAIWFTGDRLTVSQCTIHDCRAVGSYDDVVGYGSAIAAEEGVVTIVNSTFYGNVAEGSGTISDWYRSQIHVRNSTIVANTALDPSHGSAGFTTYEGSITVWNTIIAKNEDAVDGYLQESYGALISLGKNLSDGNLNGRLNSPTDLANQLEGLIALGEPGDNGGPTPTIALLTGSIGIDAGDNTSPPPTDQRGFARIYNGTIDIGAFEWQPLNQAPALSLPIALPPMIEDDLPVSFGVAGMLASSYSDPDGHALFGIVVEEEVQLSTLGGMSTLGVWQYSFDGMFWHDLGTVSSEAALVLPAVATLRFVPAPDDHGMTHLTFRAIDMTYTGPVSTPLERATIAVTSTGGNTPFSNRSTILLPVFPANDVPTDLHLSASSVEENQPVGTMIGQLQVTDPDLPLDTHTFEFTAGPGDDDNASFTIADGCLYTNAVFDYETKSSYSVRIRVTDAGLSHYEKAFSITVTNANEPPVAISLTADTIAENLPAGTVVGRLIVDDPDPGDTHSLSLSNSEDAPDFESFEIVGDELRTRGPFDFEARQEYTIRVQAVDPGSLTTSSLFTVYVQDVNEAPVGMLIDNCTVPENAAEDALIGTIVVMDPDLSDSHTLELFTDEEGPDSAAFQLIGHELHAAQSFNHEERSTYMIGIRAIDAGGLNFEDYLLVEVEDVPEPPTSIRLEPPTIVEGQAGLIGVLASDDEDDLEWHTYEFVEGEGDGDNLLFTIMENELSAIEPLDYEEASTRTVRVRVTDKDGLFLEQPIVIHVLDENEAPTDIVFSNVSIEENAGLGAFVATLSAVDGDTSDTHVFELTSTDETPDNAEFTINGDELRTAADFDYEQRSSYQIQIRATDSVGLSVTKSVDISVMNVDEPPTVPTLDNTTVAENAAAGDAIGNLQASDPDGGALQWTITSIDGSTTSTLFAIQDDQLVVADALDYETSSTHRVVIRATDDGGLYSELEVDITVEDVNEAPTAIRMDGGSVFENVVGASVAFLFAEDPDTGDTHTFSLVPGAGDNGWFTIVSNEIVTAQPLDYEEKTSATVRVRVEDAGGLDLEEEFTITIRDVNEPPVQIVLSNCQIDENVPVGTTVATISAIDPDANPSHFFELVDESGETDNALFAIIGDQLVTAGEIDYEAGTWRVIRLKATDDGGLTVEGVFFLEIGDVNEAPTNPALSNAGVEENALVGTVVGTLSADDPDAGESLIFALVEGDGDADNAMFMIDGDSLATAAELDYEEGATRTVRIGVTDKDGLTAESVFTIAVTDVNEGPTNLALSNTGIEENSGVGALIGTLSADDPDTTDTLVFELTGAGQTPDNAAFTIDGQSLLAAVDFDYEQKKTYQIQIRATDAGGLYSELEVDINVEDVNEAPTNLALSSNEVEEAAAAGTVVGTLSADDPDADETLVFELVAGDGDDDNALFAIDGDSLVTAAELNYEESASRTVRVRATDKGGLTIEGSFVIMVVDVNEAPTAIALDRTTVREHGAEGMPVALITVTDPDAGDTHTLELVDGPQGTESHLFVIEGNELRAAAAFDSGELPELRIRLRATDAGGLSVEQSFTLTVAPVPVPTIITLDNRLIEENQPAGSLVGTLVTDVPEGESQITFSLPEGLVDNALFAIEGNQVVTAEVLDFESGQYVSIRVLAEDPYGNSLTEEIVIAVLDVNDAPRDLQLSGGVIVEGTPIGTVVGTLQAFDQDRRDTHTYQLVEGKGSTHNAEFAIEGFQLVTQAGMVAADGPRSVRVRTTDAQGATFERQFSIVVNPEVDVTPPFFVLEPVVAAVSEDSVVLRWHVSEPASARIDYGTSGSLDQSTHRTLPAGDVQVLIEFLEPDTEYAARVVMNDAANNGPVESRLIVFRTLAESDRTAPEVIEGPIVTAVGSTFVEVHWRTNEPSMSIVRFNDGEIVGVHGATVPVTQHAVALAGLKPDTTYRITVESRDVHGNGPTVRELTVRTPAELDDDAPVFIESPLITELTFRTATVAWRTDEPATGVVEVETGEGERLVQIGTAGLANRHAVHVTNLQPGAGYRVRVHVYDIHGNGPAVSRAVEFRTPVQKDVAPPQIVEGPTILGVSAETATIYWRTDEPADSTVRYGLGQDLSLMQYEPELVTEHQITLTGLMPGARYGFVITSADARGNVAEARPVPAGEPRLAEVPVYEFTTRADPDTQGPAFVEGPTVASVDSRSVVIVWSTDELADMRVEIRADGSEQSRTIGDIYRRFERTAVLTHLLPETTYRYQVTVTDVSGNATVSPELTFTTGAAADEESPTVLDLTASRIGRTGARLTWRTNEPATTDVRLGTAPGAHNRPVASTGLRTSHVLDLFNLEPGTRYYVVVDSTDAAGNQAEGQTLEFVTVGDEAEAKVDLQLTATADPTVVHPGGLFFLNMEVQNAGQSVATSATLSVVLPPFISLDGSQENADWTLEGNTTVTLTLPPLDGGGHRDYRLLLFANHRPTTDTESFRIDVSLTHATDGWIDINPGDNDASVEVWFTPVAGGIQPVANIPGAQWRLFRDDFEVTGASGGQVDGLEPGLYMIEWLPLYGYLAGPAMPVEISPDSIASVFGEYLPNAPQVMSLSLPGGTNWSVGERVTVVWASDPGFTGTGAILELWRGGERVQVLRPLWELNGQGEATLVVPNVEPGDGYSVIMRSTWLPDFEISVGPITIQGRAIEVWLPTLPDAVDAGDTLAIGWRTTSALAGTTVRLELWNDGGQVAELGLDQNVGGEGLFEATIPNVTTGSDYRVRAISLSEPALWAETGAFAITGRNAVGAVWTLYE